MTLFRNANYTRPLAARTPSALREQRHPPAVVQNLQTSQPCPGRFLISRLMSFSPAAAAKSSIASMMS